MATSLKNLSDYDLTSVPDASEYKFGIVVSEWNEQITGALKKGAFDSLIKHGVKEENILVKFVPGSFELTHGAKVMLDKTDVDAVICLGCVIKGDTPHFDYVCQGVTQGITHLNVKYNAPVIFGVLTTDNLQQALDRAGGIHGNKGDEGAITAIKMVAFSKSLDQD
ncbi:6,7-dimethyl-8-ribityllumazine synthase [Saccharicrinis sp. FJH54]|uniref:6,7-dimethyl-8-ribityllumazine synthase n=1 Tax=Saccharicrinis sp. FJH54 TaxID=3344665 RepID=UPI0035D497B7